MADFCLHGSEIWGSIIDEKFLTESVIVSCPNSWLCSRVWMVAAGSLCQGELFAVLGKRKDIFKIAEKTFEPVNSEFTSH